MKNVPEDSIKEAVYEIVRLVPKGRATSYGAIAKAVGYPHYSRMVGRIIASCNSGNNDTPAHRVVNSQGVLSGRQAFGLRNEMRELLEAEGVTVINNRIKNWRAVFWNPLDEINF